MAKNIVVCCDGTGDEYGKNGTNVVKLYTVLIHDGAKQIAFYDPGVGTFSIKPMATKPGLMIQKSVGLAFGVGLRENVTDAYSFLMKNIADGDRLYIFGFSRGAYTARVVASLIRGVGILRRECENLIPYALRYIEAPRGEVDWARLNEFKQAFSSDISISQLFLGLWDTVSSVAWLWDRLYFLFTARNEAADVVRHAVSIDERRAFFRTNLWGEPFEDQDVKQVWFSGVHRDVGGGYPEEECGLSKLALEWMLCEARDKGLEIDAARASRVLNRAGPPDPEGPLHKSLRGAWWPGELFPKMPYSRGRRRLRFNVGRRRTVPEGATLHETVEIRRSGKLYNPGNLPDKYEIEPWRPCFSASAPPV